MNLAVTEMIKVQLNICTQMPTHLDTNTHTYPNKHTLKGLLPLYSPPPLNLYSNAQAPLIPHLNILFLKKSNEAILSIRLDSVFNIEFMT